MKRDYKTKSEWIKAYKEKKELLKCTYTEVGYKDFYRDLFPVGSFQGRKIYSDKANAMVTVCLNIKGGKSYDRKYVMTDEHGALDKYIAPHKTPKNKDTKKLVLISPCSFYGASKTKKNAHELYAMAIDLDYVGKQQLKNIIKQWGNGARAIPPTYVVSSGRGLHLYYLLDKPVPLYAYYEEQLSQLKKDIINFTWNETTSIKGDSKDMAGVTQAFRAVGSETKLGVEYLVTAYKVSDHRYSIDELYDWVKDRCPSFLHERPSLKDALEIYKSRHIPMAEAKEKYPDWYKKRIVEGIPKKDIGWTCNHALYDWWIDTINVHAKVGGRYYAIMALGAYALKCNIPYKQVKKDALQLLPKLESLTDDELNHFTRDDIIQALEYMKKGSATTGFKMTRKHISEKTMIEIPPNKRNGRKQAVHLKIARSTLDIMNEDKGVHLQGRKSKQQVVREWRQMYPNGRKCDCIKDTGLDKKTVYKWWDEEC